MIEKEITDITSEYQQQMADIQKAIYNSKFTDPDNPPTRSEILKSYGKRGEMSKFYKPDAYDISQPEVQYKLSWQMYLSVLLIHGKPKNKKATKRFDKSKERKSQISRLYNYLKQIPTTEDLEKAYPILSSILSDGLREVINKDIRSFF